MVRPVSCGSDFSERGTGPEWARASTAAGLGAIVLWSTTIAGARSLSEQVGPLTAGASVYLVGGVCSFLWAFLMRKGAGSLLSGQRRYLFGCGLLFALYTVLLYVAVGLAANRAQVLEIGLINYLWPAATVVLSRYVLGQRASGWLWPGTVLALLGVYWVMTGDGAMPMSAAWKNIESNSLPYLLAFAAALAWAFYSNLTRRWTTPGSRGAAPLFIMGTGVVLAVVRCFFDEAAVWSGRAMTETAVLGGVTAVAYGLWDLAMRRGNLPWVVVCSYFTPLLSTLVSCLYLRVPPSPRVLLGCVLLIGGSFLTWLSVSPRKR